MCSLGDGTDASQLYRVFGCSCRCVLLSTSYVKASLRLPLYIVYNNVHSDMLRIHNDNDILALDSSDSSLTVWMTAHLQQIHHEDSLYAADD
jgi:hypothetical protein